MSAVAAISQYGMEALKPGGPVEQAFKGTMRLIEQHQDQIKAKRELTDQIAELRMKIKETKEYLRDNKIPIPKFTGNGLITDIENWISKKSKEGHVRRQEARLLEIGKLQQELAMLIEAKKAVTGNGYRLYKKK